MNHGITTHFKRIVFMISVLLLSSCGGGGDSSSSGIIEPPVIDPTYTVNFANNAALAGSSKVILVFDKTLDPSKVSITGTLAAESDGGVWTATTLANDTLTISPATSWTASSGKTLLIEVKDATGGVIQTINLNYTIDLTAPQVTNVLPVSAETIGGSQQIVIIFDESMDISSLSLSGSMQAKSDLGVWSSTGENSNDKLTLTPTPSWDAGAGQTLTVDVNDTVGNPLISLNLSYNVDLTIPSVISINVPNGSIILAAQSIVIIFDRSMDTGSLALGSNMAAEASFGVWSNTNTANDTLTVSPSTTWTVGYWDNNDGVAQELSINASDLLGNSLSTITLGYIVDVISVSSLGDDGNLGTMNLPMENIYSAMNKANSNGIKNVYIQSGIYTQAFDLIDGINIKGGFDTGWILDDYTVTDHKVILEAVGQNLIIALNLSIQTQVENLVLQGPDFISPAATPRSSYVMRVYDSSNLVISNVNIIAGKGQDGNAGDNGVDKSGSASGGSKGNNANQLSDLCDDSTFAPGGTGGGGGQRAGGRGGNGGTVDTSCYSNLNASDGEPGIDAAAYAGGSDGKGGNPGQGDKSGICNSILVGGDGAPGTHGQSGNDGLASGRPTGSVIGGFWVVTSDGLNGDPGTDAMGGGGGGGSGGCDDGTDKYGAGGGGGGAGGVAATVSGSGGIAGGYSFGIFALNSSITTNNVEITLGTGGAGGDGGSSGTGQTGGDGGVGGSWVDDTVNSGIAGGNGGTGGIGGNSGAGAGGSGGSVYGIFSQSSTIITNNTNFTGGIPGAGGSGPNSGPDGNVMNIVP